MAACRLAPHANIRNSQSSMHCTTATAATHVGKMSSIAPMEITRDAVTL